MKSYRLFLWLAAMLLLVPTGLMLAVEWGLPHLATSLARSVGWRGAGPLMPPAEVAMLARWAFALGVVAVLGFMADVLLARPPRTRGR